MTGVEGVDVLEKLISLGGNGLAAVCAWIAWNAYKDIRENIQANTRAIIAFKLALVASSPRAAAAIERHEADEEARLTAKG